MCEVLVCFIFMLYSGGMKKSVKASAPGNISCIFKVYENEDPLKAGSSGLGFTVDKSVIVEVSPSPFSGIFFNGKKINIPTVRKVIDLMFEEAKTKIKVDITSELPLGCGFGLSGASALAASYAINELFDFGHSNLELAKIAHIAEVTNKTGMGDVTSQYFGGCIFKEKPSSEFEVIKIPLNETPVYCRFFSKLSTKSVLSSPEIKESVNIAAAEVLGKVAELIKKSGNDKTPVKFQDLVSLSYEFALKSGLLTHRGVISLINRIRRHGGEASMIMLGNAVFSSIPFEGALALKISNNPAHLL